MTIRITASVSIAGEALDLCKQYGVEPIAVIETDGFDGASTMELLLKFGPDTMNLLTALLALWNEIQKTRDGSKRRRLEIAFEEDKPNHSESKN